MPLEFDGQDFGDSDEDGAGARPRFRYDRARRPWWRPKSKAGRIFLGAVAVAVIAAVSAAALSLRTYLDHDARFRIAGTADIETTGLTEVSRAEMLPVFGEDIGRDIFFVPLAERRRQLEQIPWVERATVMRLLPGRIRVDIVERQPVAFTREGSRIGLVDANGVLLAMSPAAMARHHYSFPVLTGIDPGDPLAARKARINLYLRLMNALDSTGQHYSRQISEIDLTDPEDARVLMPERGSDILAHFGEDHFLERYLRYQAHIAEWKREYPRLAAVDLRYGQQVVLEMATGGQTTDAPNATVRPKPAAGQAAHTKPHRGRATRRRAARARRG